MICFIRRFDVQGIGIRIGINGNGLDAHATGGFDHTAGDLTAIGDQNFARHVITCSSSRDVFPEKH